MLAIYPLGRLLFGPLGALCAMLFMAVSRWHLTMSRWGWVEVMPPFFQVVATFFLVRGLRERRALDFVLGGLASGLMMYTYLSFRLVLATLVLVSLYWMALDPEGPTAGVRRHWRGVAIFFLAWAIVFSPLAVTYISQPGTFNARVDQLNVLNEVKQQGNLEPLAISVTRHLKAFHQEGDHNGRHNLPGEPQTDPVTGLLFVVGLGYGLLRLRDRRMGLLWFWWIFGMVGGVFSGTPEAPQAFRSLTAVPAIALLAGGVLASIGRGAVYLLPHHDPAAPAKRFGGWARGFGVLVVAAGLIGSALWESNVYFGRQAESVSVRSAFHSRPTLAAAEAITALKEGSVVYLTPPFNYLSIVQFLTYGALREDLGRNTLTDPPYRTARPANSAADTGPRERRPLHFGRSVLADARLFPELLSTCGVRARQG